MVSMKQVLFPVLCLLLAACGQSGSADSSDAANPVAQVRTALAVSGNAAQTVTAYGVAEQAAGNEHALTTQAEATLARIVAPTGTAVGAGQVVAILSPSPNARLDLAKAGTDARAAQAALARAIRLKKDGLASDSDVNSAQASYQSAVQTLTAARQRSSTLVLRAPVAGTVQGLTAKPGDLLAAGTAVASIGTRGDLRARLGVDPSVAARVRAGQPITIAATNPASTIATNVVGVDPMVDPTSHLASIFAPLPGTQFGAGEPIHATITVSGGGGGVIVPYSTLMDDGGQTYMFVVRNGIASRRDVTPGNSSGDTIQILKGLQPGERVVTEGGTALQDGMHVREEGTTRAAKRAR
jgi:RND family efflux transporter MFP subunit